jgi:hypothetical protein
MPKFWISFFLVIYLAVFSLFSFGQNLGDSTMISFRNLSMQSNTDAEKTRYSDSLRAQIKRFLLEKGSYEKSLSKIPYLGDLRSPDEAFRMITWNLSLKDGTYDYYCFIQLKADKGNPNKWFELVDHHKNIQRPEYKTLKKDNWYGALYYSIIPFKKDKKTMYALLGWEGNNKFSNKKIIESMYFSKKGEPVFGKSIFETNRVNKRRVIFEYSKEAYLMLRYNEKMKQIIFNRLEPSKPELKGLYSFYQPTMEYDSYKYKKGNWIIELDVNPRNKKNDKEFHNPKDLKPPKK